MGYITEHAKGRGAEPDVMTRGEVVRFRDSGVQQELRSQLSPVCPKCGSTWGLYRKTARDGNGSERWTCRQCGRNSGRPSPTGKQLLEFAGVPEMPLAACADRPDVNFFPDDAEFRGREPEQRKAIALAVSVCKTCSEIDVCREWAIRTTERFGIWGGLTPKQRVKIRGEVRRHASIQDRPKGLQPCGTRAAYDRHLRHKEVPCDPCKIAMRVYRKLLDDRAMWNKRAARAAAARAAEERSSGT